MNHEPTHFEFLPWLQTMGVTAGVALAVCYLASAMRLGLLGAGDMIFGVLRSAAADLIFLSPRRTWAIARLSVKESVRKQAVAGLILFMLVLAVALWFLDPESIDPSALYVSFVLTAVNYLVLLMAVVTSAFSIPNDIKHKTIYTIVTKPVRPSEIVLGRMLGFSIVCTVPLVIMGFSSYFFVVRSLDHTHVLTEADLHAVASAGTPGAPEKGSLEGATSTFRNHKHRITLDAAGNGTTQTSDSSKLVNDDSDNFLERFGQTHWHRVTASERDGRRIYTVGPPEGQFHARVPIYGELAFKDHLGETKSEGLNVGNFTNRGYIAGGSLGAAMFRFDGVQESEFPDGIRVEMDIQLFRTTKEGIDKPILGSLTLRNPSTGLISSPRNFAARENYTLEQFIPRTLTDGSGKTIDLFEDLVHDGAVIIELQCIPRSQHFGVGPKDLYLLAREGRFDVNIAKAFFGIWLQVMLTVAIGVFWSTFLSGNVALLATALSILSAVIKPLLISVTQGKLFGAAIHSGGMIEAGIRTFQQKATAVELDAGTTTDVVKKVDSALNQVVEGFLRFVPDFSNMNDIESVSRGLDVSPNLVFDHALQAGAFALPLFLAGFLIFKLVEVAKS